MKNYNSVEELINDAIRDRSSITIGEATEVVIATFDALHIQDDRLLCSLLGTLIENFTQTQTNTVKEYDA